MIRSFSSTVLPDSKRICAEEVRENKFDSLPQKIVQNILSYFQGLFDRSSGNLDLVCKKFYYLNLESQLLDVFASCKSVIDFKAVDLIELFIRFIKIYNGVFDKGSQAIWEKHQKAIDSLFEKIQNSLKDGRVASALQDEIDMYYAISNVADSQELNFVIQRIQLLCHAAQQLNLDLGLMAEQAEWIMGDYSVKKDYPVNTTFPVINANHIESGFANASMNCSFNSFLHTVIALKTYRTAYETISRHYLKNDNTMMDVLEVYKHFRTLQQPVPKEASQFLREALHIISEGQVSCNANTQLDLHEIFLVLMGIYQDVLDKMKLPLPNDLFFQLNTKTYYRESRVPMHRELGAATPGLILLPGLYRDAEFIREENLTREFALLLDIGTSKTTIDEVLQNYFINSSYQHENHFKVGESSVPFAAYRQDTSFNSVPNQFSAIFKRFGGNGLTGFYKINTVVRINSKVYLSSPAIPSNEKISYTLVAFAVHLGEFGGGHYIHYKLVEGNWIELNDEVSRVVCEDEITFIMENNTNSYVHHYVKDTELDRLVPTALLKATQLELSSSAFQLQPENIFPLELPEDIWIDILERISKKCHQLFFNSFCPSSSPLTFSLLEDFVPITLSSEELKMKCLENFKVFYSNTALVSKFWNKTMRRYIVSFFHRSSQLLANQMHLRSIPQYSFSAHPYIKKSHLTALHFKSVSSVPQQLFDDLLDESSSIRHLILEENQIITYLPKNCQNLYSLNIIKCLNFASLPGSMPELRQLKINLCPQISSLPQLPKVQEMILNSCHSLTALPPCMPELRSIYVVHCTQLKNAVLNDCQKLTFFSFDEGVRNVGARQAFS